MAWIAELRRCLVHSSFSLFEVYVCTNGLPLTCGCLRHCQRFVNKRDPFRYLMRIRKVRLGG